MDRSITRRAAIILLSVLVFMQMFPLQIFAEDSTQGNSQIEEQTKAQGGESSQADAQTDLQRGTDPELIYYTTADGTVESRAASEVKIITSADSGITTLSGTECGGWYAVQGDVTISNDAYNCLTCSGAVNLILLDGASLSVKSTRGTALNVESDNSITITSGCVDSAEIAGTGKLTCIGKDIESADVMGSAGIGYGTAIDWERDIGDIVINGGEVYAEGGSSWYAGPGIGTTAENWTREAYRGKGTITINGGKTTAKAGQPSTATYSYGNSGIDAGYNTIIKGFYVNGGELYLEGSGGMAAAFCGSNSKESIVGDNVAVIGDDTTLIDHDNTDMTEELTNYTKLHFIKGFSYIDENGKQHTVTGSKLTADTTVLDASAAESYGGIFYSEEDLQLDHSLKVSGDVRLILAAGTTLGVTGDTSGKAGIRVNSGNSLKLYSTKAGTASLAASGNSDYAGAGIGATASDPCGAISISNVKVTAQGSREAPGIGGSGGANGTITINSGDVTATGGSNGTGIGGGETASGDVLIKGGTVKAYGVGEGAGIGGSDAVNVTISGGSVEAYGDSKASRSGAGIGGCFKCGNGAITISGDKTVVAATGGKSSAGIGTGTAHTSKLTGKTISINGGTVTATGGNQGAGIGGGLKGEATDVVINGGAVTAKGGASGAGIGGGDKAGAASITINGGTVAATGGSNAAGIGGGNGAASTNIAINGGTVTATGGNQGAGIGGGYGYYGGAGNIAINGGSVTATGGSKAAGIGTGMSGNGGSIELNGGSIKATSENSADAVGAGKGGSIGSVLADAEEFVWALESGEKLEDVLSIDNDGEDLAGTLAGKVYVYANHSLNSLGVEFEPFIGKNVPAEDRETIYNNIDQITITVKDRVARKDAQLELLSKMLEEEYPDETEREKYIDTFLKTEGQSVDIRVYIEIKVTNSNLKGGDEAFIEYSLTPTAFATFHSADGYSKEYSCEMTVDDFDPESGGQKCILEVSMPTCGSFVPGSVSHISSDGSEIYEVFTENGTKKFSYNSATKVVTVDIGHCSNLRISAKKSVNTGDWTDMTMLPILLGAILIAAIAAVAVLRRKLRAK